MKLGDKILELARLRGLDLRKIASLSGVKYDRIRSYTRAAQRCVPPLPKALMLARALEVPLDWFADDSQGFPIPQAAPPVRIHPWPPAITWEELEACLLAGLAISSATGKSAALGGINPIDIACWLSTLPPEAVDGFCRDDASVRYNLKRVAEAIQELRVQQPPGGPKTP